MGQVLMAVNPFEVIPNIYGKDVIQRSPILQPAIGPNNYYHLLFTVDIQIHWVKDWMRMCISFHPERITICAIAAKTNLFSFLANLGQVIQ